MAQRSSAKKREYRVYVIRLDDKVMTLARMNARNPSAKTGKPPLYVGYSAHDPKVRFKQHKAGYRASRTVKRYGKWLAPRFFKRLPRQANRAGAEALESMVAAELRTKGYPVWEGQLGPLQPIVRRSASRTRQA